MPRVSPAYLGERRREILAAAHRCFARDGFREVTMQRIAAEAGLSVGALYRYFEGKEALIAGLAEWGRSQKADVLAALEPGAGVNGVAELIRRMVALLPVSSDAGDAVRFDVRIWGEALGQAEMEALVAEGLASLREPVADYVATEVEAGRMRRGTDGMAVARVVVSLLTGLELQLALDAGLDREAYVRAARGLLGSLDASAPAREGTESEA